MAVAGSNAWYSEASPMRCFATRRDPCFSCRCAHATATGTGDIREDEMTLRHDTHWGSLLFSVIVGIVVWVVIGARLTAPIGSPSVAEADEPEPTAPASDRVPFPAELHSRWYTQTLPLSLTAGEIGYVTIQYRNVGHTEWILGSPSELRLGEVGARPLPPEMRVDWFHWDRPARQTELVVRPYQLATFTFRVAGVAPGAYRLEVRPVVDGVAWLEDEGVYVDITVM
jgi:hypothetical protein